jgi:hypothetical protein
MFLKSILYLVSMGWGISTAAQSIAREPVSRTDLPPLSQPVIEVAALRVAPVVAAATDTRAKGALPGVAPGAAASAKNGEREVELRTQKSEQWPNLLSRVATALAAKLPESAVQARHEALPPLLPGKFLRARARAGSVVEIDYIVSVEEAYAIHLRDAAPQVRRLAGDPRLVERMRADPAKASLFTAADAIGLPENIALQLTEIFAGEVDFLRELHQGYRCAIVYEAHYREGFIEPSGRILAAEMDIGKRQFRAYYSKDTQGRDAYFDGSGKNTRRVFRRMPLEFTRITSDYTLARFHPILGVWTAHRGVDYAAPTGTRIMSVAEGVVESVGPLGGYGNLVVLRHQDKFKTYYAHMNAFAPKLAVGLKVAQGETIGFVGMTGLATGPHLHFEFHVRSPSGEWTSVPAPEVIDTTVTAAPGFAARVQGYRDSLTAAENSNLLILE